MVVTGLAPGSKKVDRPSGRSGYIILRHLMPSSWFHTVYNTCLNAAFLVFRG